MSRSSNRRIIAGSSATLLSLGFALGGDAAPSLSSNTLPKKGGPENSRVLSPEEFAALGSCSLVDVLNRPSGKRRVTIRVSGLPVDRLRLTLKNDPSQVAEAPATTTKGGEGEEVFAAVSQMTDPEGTRYVVEAVADFDNGIKGGPIATGCGQIAVGADGGYYPIKG